jgi:hypothetical protein
MSPNINAPQNPLPTAVPFDEVKKKKKKPRTPTNTFPQGARIGTVKTGIVGTIMMTHEISMVGVLVATVGNCGNVDTRLQQFDQSDRDGIPTVRSSGCRVLHKGEYTLPQSESTASMMPTHQVLGTFL